DKQASWISNLAARPTSRIFEALYGFRSPARWIMRVKSRRTGRRWPHSFSPRLEVLESRVLPGDTLLGIAVVARQAFALTSWTPLAAVVSEGAEPTTPADPWSDAEGAAPPAGRAGSKRFLSEEPAQGRIRASAAQNVVFQVAEA